MCNDLQTWRNLEARKPQVEAKISVGSRVAPSHNWLSPEAFKQRDQKVQIQTEKVQKLGLTLPETVSGTVPIANHCLAMSLKFIKTYRSGKPILDTAKSMSGGTDIETAKMTLAYHQLIKLNSKKPDLLNISRVAIANLMELNFAKSITLFRSFDQIIPTLKSDTIENGEYIITLPNNHVISLIKTDWQLYIYDCNHGTDFVSNNEEFFLNLLKENRVHLTESLSLIKIGEGENIKETIEYEEKPEIKFQVTEGKRWGTATLGDYKYIYDQKTGYIYNSDPKWLIRLKCFLLIPRTIIGTPLGMIYHLSLTILGILSLNKKMVQENAADFFRTPIFDILKLFTATYGLFDPYNGRRIYGLLERTLNRQNHDVDIRKKSYAAPCFTPLNHGLPNPHDNRASAQKLIFYSNRLTEFLKTKNPLVELYCGWRHSIKRTLCCTN